MNPADLKQMIASWVQQLGRTKPLTGHEITAVRPSVPETPQAVPVAQTAPPAPSLDPEQVQQMTQSLAALRQTVGQLAAGQDRMAREMARLEADLVDILLKMPEPQRRERQ